MSITITLPDGSRKSCEPGVTPLDVAKSIGPRLAQAAVGCKVNGTLADLNRPINEDAALEIITAKSENPDALYFLRHSTAHVMAEALQKLWPGTGLAYGPPVDQ